MFPALSLAAYLGASFSEVCKKPAVFCRWSLFSCDVSNVIINAVDSASAFVVGAGSFYRLYVCRVEVEFLRFCKSVFCFVFNRVVLCYFYSRFFVVDSEFCFRRVWFAVIIWGCKADRVFSVVKRLSVYERNYPFCRSFFLAIHFPFRQPKECTKLKLLRQTTSYRQSFQEKENRRQPRQKNSMSQFPQERRQ